MGVAPAALCPIEESGCLFPAAGTDPAGDQHTVGKGHLRGLRLDDAQAVAVRAYAPAFGLMFLDIIGIVENAFPAGPEPILFLSLSGVARRVHVLIEDLGAKAAYILADLGSLPRGGRRPVRFSDVVRGQPRKGEADAQVDIGQSPADGIAALEHGHVGTEGRVQGSVSLSGKLLVGQGIREVVVLPRGINHEIGLKIVKDGKDDIFEDIEVSLVRCPWGQGDIDRPAKSCGAAVLAEEARSGIEGPAVLMKGNEKGVRVIPENILAAIGMMHIRVHDGDAQGPAIGMLVMIAYPGDHDGLVVDVAEAVAVRHAHGVVSRGTYEGEGLLLPVLENEAGGRDGTACGSQMRVRGHRLNAGQTEMHAFYVGVAAELGPVFRDALDIENSFFLELVARVEQTLFTLGEMAQSKAGKKTTPRLFTALVNNCLSMISSPVPEKDGTVQSAPGLVLENVHAVTHFGNDAAEVRCSFGEDKICFRHYGKLRRVLFAADHHHSSGNLPVKTVGRRVKGIGISHGTHRDKIIFYAIPQIPDERAVLFRIHGLNAQNTVKIGLINLHWLSSSGHGTGGPGIPGSTQGSGRAPPRGEPWNR